MPIPAARRLDRLGAVPTPRPTPFPRLAWTAPDAGADSGRASPQSPRSTAPVADTGRAPPGAVTAPRRFWPRAAWTGAAARRFRPHAAAGTRSINSRPKWTESTRRTKK